MADEKHLEILKQGVEAWNQWREENPDIKPDLRGGYLRRANLIGANLINANLDGVNLRSANLADANCFSAIFIDASFDSADLRNANFDGAVLITANLNGAILLDANFRDSDLTGAKFYNAVLIGANFKDANLSGVILNNANAKKAELSSVNLKRVQALSTNFEGSNLTGACIEDWNINSQTNFQNVRCDYIYLKEIYSNEEKELLFSDRRPHDPNKIFAPGEFTKLFQKALETVDLIFSDGIDWQAFLVSFNKLQIECGSDELSINSFENKGNGVFVIRVNVPDDADKAEIEKYLKKQYQLEATVEAQQRELTNLYKVTELLAGRTINVTNQASGNTYNTEKAGIVHNEGTISGNAKIAAVINEAVQQDLTQAAAEIQQLLEQLSKTNPTETKAEQMMVGVKVVEEIEKDPTLKQRIINALKAMTVEAFMEAIDHPLANVVRAGIEGYREPS